MIHSFPTMYILGGGDVVEMGQIKVFVQELGLKQWFLACTHMNYLFSKWPGTQNFKGGANFDKLPQNMGAPPPICNLLESYGSWLSVDPVDPFTLPKFLPVSEF